MAEWLEWAEEVGLGELEMMPEQFWGLTFREFNIKLAAFKRAEDRRRSLVFELAAKTGHYKKRVHDELLRATNILRRYPVKAWTQKEK